MNIKNLPDNYEFTLTVVLGETEMTVDSLLNLEKDSIILLDKFLGQPFILKANNKPIATGEISIDQENEKILFTIISMETTTSQHSKKDI